MTGASTIYVIFKIAVPTLAAALVLSLWTRPIAARHPAPPPRPPAGSASAQAPTPVVVSPIAQPPPAAGLAAVIPVGRQPFHHLTVGAGAVWVPVSGDGTVARIDPRTNQVVATIPIGDRARAGRFGLPTAVAVVDGSVWVTKNDEQAVVEIDPRTNAVVATIPVGIDPFYMAGGDGTLWVTSREDAETQPGCCTIVRVDTRRREVVARIDGVPTPGGVAMTADAVWVVNHRADTLSRIDPRTNAIVATVSLGGPGPSPVCSLCAGYVAAGAGGVWVTLAAADRVVRVDPERNEVAATIPFVPNSLDVAADDRWVWVTSFDGRSLSRIDPETNRVVARSLFHAPLAGLRLDAGAAWVTSIAANVVGHLRLLTDGAARPPDAAPVTITEYSIPTEDSQLRPDGMGGGGITVAPDGAVWFFEPAANKIGQLTPDGRFAEYAIPAAPSVQGFLAAGPDGAVWFTLDVANAIGRITPEGEVTIHPLPPEGDPATPQAVLGITTGPDGALWFTSRRPHAIGRLTLGGEVTLFPLPRPDSGPLGIVSGPDGALWFVLNAGNAIGRITTAGEITVFPLPTPASAPLRIAAGPDGALWFTQFRANLIGRITTDGRISEFAIPSAQEFRTPAGTFYSSGPTGIAAGPDGALWFTQSGVNQVGRITPDGVVSEYPVPTPASRPFAIADGPGRDLWFVQIGGNKVARLQAR